MISLHTDINRIDYLKSLITNKSRFDYLDKYIQDPAIINEEKLYMLHILMDDTDLTSSHQESIIITTMLIQIALDTHDLILDAEEAPVNSTNKISQQLTVLAGDYYSGLYYLILSETNDFRLIKYLARAIKEINEEKMKLYYREFQSVSQFFAIIKQIESLLFTHVAQYCGAPTFIPIIEKWLLLQSIHMEMTSYNRGEKQLYNHWFKGADLDIANEIKDIALQEYAELQQAISQLPSTYEKQRKLLLKKLHAQMFTEAQYWKKVEK